MNYTEHQSISKIKADLAKQQQDRPIFDSQGNLLISKAEYLKMQKSGYKGNKGGN